MNEWEAVYDFSSGLWAVTDGQTVLYLYASNVEEDEVVMLADTMNHYSATEEAYLA